MTAELEPLVSVLRVFEDGQAYGDPYSWCCTVQWLDRHTVQLCGVLKAPTPTQWRAIDTALARLGVTHVRFERKAGARQGVHLIPTTDLAPQGRTLVELFL